MLLNLALLGESIELNIIDDTDYSFNFPLEKVRRVDSGM